MRRSDNSIFIEAPTAYVRYDKVTQHHTGVNMTDALLSDNYIKAGTEYFKRVEVPETVSTTGSIVSLDSRRSFGDGTPLTAFTISLTNAIRDGHATIFGTGFSARPTALNNSIYKIDTEPATYDNTKELMVMLRFISVTKIIVTITQY
jgi:hypothetical protein